MLVVFATSIFRAAAAAAVVVVVVIALRARAWGSEDVSFDVQFWIRTNESKRMMMTMTMTMMMMMMAYHKKARAAAAMHALASFALFAFTPLASAHQIGS